MPLHIVPLAFLLLALATALVFFAAEHRPEDAKPPFGPAGAGEVEAPLSPFGSGAAMRNLLF